MQRKPPTANAQDRAQTTSPSTPERCAGCSQEDLLLHSFVHKALIYDVFVWFTLTTCERFFYCHFSSFTFTFFFFPLFAFVRLYQVEHGALREWLEKVRDGRRTVTHLTARHDLKYGGCLSVSGAAHLSACLPACPHLTTMCLRGHRVGLQGGKLLARGLKQAPALTYLDLSANALTAHGAVPLCAALVSSRGGRRLQVLLLDANRIEGDGCCAVLATGLRELRSRKRLPALSHLSLSNNPKLIGLSRLHAEVSEVNAAKINGSNGAEEKEGGASSGDKERLEPLLVVFPKATLPVESP